MRTIRTVCTHDGSFHADEALAVFLLKQLYPGIAVTRSRDPAVHEKNDMLVDVGAIYDPSKLRFDHHQRGFTETFSEHHKSTILSSAGLIYKAFGRDVLSLLGVPSIDLETVFLRVYNEFVEGIDGEDNGVPNSLNKYKDNTNLGSRVARLNKVLFFHRKECFFFSSVKKKKNRRGIEAFRTTAMQHFLKLASWLEKNFCFS